MILDYGEGQRYHSISYINCYTSEISVSERLVRYGGYGGKPKEPEKADLRAKILREDQEIQEIVSILLASEILN